MGLRCESAAYSHIGGRSNNEDNFFLNGVYLQREMLNQGGKCETEFRDGTQIYAVCDGMGGAMYGEEASLLAVESLKNYKSICAQPDSSGNIVKLLRQISQGINNVAVAKGIRPGESGSTIAMLLLKDNVFRTVNVGDSRVYRLRDGVLECLTKDHSQIQMMIDAGELTKESAWRHPLKNIITQHLGMAEDTDILDPAISQRFEMHADDKYLICSDGLSDVVREEVIAEIMRSDESAVASAETLVKRALAEAEELNVVPDNITVIRVNVKELGENGSALKTIRKLGIYKLLLGAFMALLSMAMLGISVDIVRFFIR